MIRGILRPCKDESDTWEHPDYSRMTISTWVHSDHTRMIVMREIEKLKIKTFVVVR